MYIKYNERGEIMGRWKVKKTQREFEMEVYQKHPHIKILENYVDAKTKIWFECLVCKHKWASSPDNILHNNGCPRCTLIKRGKKRRKTNEQFLQEVAARHPELIVNSEYISSEVKVNCTCKICGHKSDYYPATLTHGSGGCFVCGNNKISEALTMSLDEFTKQLRMINDNIIIIGGYTNASEHVDVECKVCGHRWSPVAKSLTHGAGCPRCAMSHGERTIKRYLDDYNVEYVPQKQFEQLVGINGGLLSYDFYLPQYNLLIEYQGEYHDGTVPIQTEVEFLKQQEHDKRKKEYAKVHNIKLLEIWYWDFGNIEQILHNTLHNLVTTIAV